jgi:hypothetical protein
MTKIIPSAQPQKVTSTRPVYSEPAKITKPIGGGKVEPSLRPPPAPPQR